MMKIVDIYITFKGSFHRKHIDFCDSYSYCAKTSTTENLQTVLSDCRSQIAQLEDSHSAAIYKELQILNAEHQELSKQVIELQEEWNLIESFLTKQGIAIENGRPNFSNYALPQLKAEPVEAEFEDNPPF